MELNWSTLVLEVVNFLVLVWILKRFLYRPVLAVIARRREQIEATLERARSESERGEALQARYEQRLAAWERERDDARRALERDMNEERAGQLEALKSELEDERKKARVLAEREQREAEHRLERKALALGARFASALLGRVAGPALEHKLLEAALQDLGALPEDSRERLRRALRGASNPIEVTSATALGASDRKALEECVRELAGRAVTCRYREDPELVAGIRLRLGSFLLHASVLDEVRGFADAADE